MVVALSEYIVLELRDGDWRQVRFVQASSSDAAIRDVFNPTNTPVKSGTYVAVPARSWKPRTVTTKQTVRVVLGEPEKEAAA